MKKGFTLVELLVVIGIMAVMLTTVSVISIRGTLQKSNDQKRKADLESVRAALEQYKSNSQTREYPNVSIWMNLTPTLTPYMPVAPADPVGNSYYYGPLTDGFGKISKYQMCAYLEAVPQPTPGACGTNTCGGSFVCNYKVGQP